jgi:hypothetical protein
MGFSSSPIPEASPDPSHAMEKTVTDSVAALQVLKMC